MLDRSLVILSVPCVFEGCECILEQIIFDDNEILPAVAVAGKPIELEFLPISLLLRATGAKWVLPQSQLPRLSSTVDLRGLFQLKPTSTYIQREVGPKDGDLVAAQVAPLLAETLQLPERNGEPTV